MVFEPTLTARLTKADWTAVLHALDPSHDEPKGAIEENLMRDLAEQLGIALQGGVEFPCETCGKARFSELSSCETCRESDPAWHEEQLDRIVESQEMDSIDDPWD